MSSASFNEKTTAGFDGGGAMDGLDSEVYLFIDIHQLEATVGSNDLFLSCHFLGSIDAMLQFIHAILVPVHACLIDGKI